MVLKGGLNPGEKAAIALAGVLRADLLLIDERDGVKVARKEMIARNWNARRSRYRRQPPAWSILQRPFNGWPAPHFTDRNQSADATEKAFWERMTYLQRGSFVQRRTA
jgi:hypothetical protein